MIWESQGGATAALPEAYITYPLLSGSLGKRILQLGIMPEAPVTKGEDENICLAEN